MERLEVIMSDKEVIRVMERLVLFSDFLYPIALHVNRLSVGIAQAVFLGHVTHYRESRYINFILSLNTKIKLTRYLQLQYLYLWKIKSKS